MLMRYEFKPSAIKDLKKLPVALRRGILNKLEFYAASKDPLQFAKPLRDRRFGEYRFRIGDYRVLFDVDYRRGAMIILAIGHRKDIYR